MSDIVKKQINDFVLDTNPQGDVSLLIQTAAGITKRTTKTSLLNDVNASLIGLQNQINNISGVDLTDYALNSTVIDISGSLQTQINNLDSVYATDASLVAISSNLQTQLDNINASIFSSIDCVIGEQYYNVVYGVTITNPMPVISLVLPSISDVFLIAIIYDVTSLGFSIALSQPPTKTGYKINWSVNL